MGAIFRLVRYLVGAALVVAGAGYMGLCLAVPLASSPEILEKPLEELARVAITGADPMRLGIGGAAALVGLLLARPVFSITFARRPRRPGVRKKRPLGRVVKDLTSPDPEVRLEAVSDLLSAADPSTIPALIDALGDPTTKVRGQACEALANLTGETFDFVDIAPEPVRAESVATWRAWWREHAEAILSGTDPRDLAAASVAVAPTPAAVVPSPGVPVRRGPRSKTSKTAPIRRPPSTAVVSEPELPPLDDIDDVPVADDIEAAGDRAVAAEEPATAALRGPPAPTSGDASSSESGRNASLGDVIRRKRMREAKEAATGRPGQRSPVAQRRPSSRPSAPAPPAPPAKPNAGGSAAPPAGSNELPPLDDLETDELPSLDD